MKTSIRVSAVQSETNLNLDLCKSVITADTGIIALTFSYI